MAFFGAFALVPGLVACKQEMVTVDVAKSRGGWNVHPRTPVIRAGDFRHQGLWNDPHVLKEDGRYVMYLTSSTVEPFKPPVLPFRAVSKDGVHWSLDPKQPLLKAKGTPFASIETPSVVRFKGRYHMFYTGVYKQGRTPPMAVGHAVSDDGIHWTSDKKPVLEATGNNADWNGYLVAEPGAVVYNDRIYVYFSAVGARKGGKPPQSQTIGLAITDDGRSFGKPRVVLKQSPTYPAKQGFVGYSTPAAAVHNGKVHLFYDVAHFAARGNPQWQQVALHHAVSDGGEHGFRQDAKPLFSREDFSWTSGEILAPSALFENGKVKLWFAGHVAIPELAPMIQRGWKGREFGIGFVSMDIDRFLQPR